ncbi:hypothetical protein J3E64_001557 [Sphingobium sp. OAS761]|uniref:hypothetical protein n=1 Tax=Sphingobium sp. OAS761 TaxID=2817901 RepID=UPI00209E9EA8|nr:hypothetical protein [Sphingobium sp. OAS761]MCP1469875.1 hypothetical protein [Sphingobium sp. OAS761]
MPYIERPAAYAGTPEHVVVPAENEVRNIDFDQGFAMTMVMLEASRQGGTDWLIRDILYPFAKRGGRIFDANGKELPIYFKNEMRTGIGLEEKLFGNDDSCAWNTNIKKHAFKRMQRRPQRRCVAKYQYYYAAFVLTGMLVTPLEDKEKATRLGLR